MTVGVTLVSRIERQSCAANMPAERHASKSTIEKKVSRKKEGFRDLIPEVKKPNIEQTTPDSFPYTRGRAAAPNSR